MPAEDVDRRHPARRPRAGARDAAARLSQGQGAAVAGDPAARPRGGARAGDPRLAAGVVRAGAARLRRQPGRRPRHRGHLGARGRGRAARLQVRGRRAPDGASSATTRASRSAGPSTEVPDDVVDRELERMREGFARLEPVERAAAEGDVAADRLRGQRSTASRSRAARRDDYLLELGAGQLIEGFEEQLAGAEAGEERKVEVTFPDDYQRRAPGRQGRPASRSRSRRCARRSCPTSTTTSPPRPRSSTRSRSCAPTSPRSSRDAAGQRIEQDFRVAAIDAAVAGATVELPRRDRRRPRDRALGAGRAPARRARHRPQHLPADAGRSRARR